MKYNTTTQVYRIDPDNPDLEIIKIAANMLLKGGLVAFPTETVYGLGANAFDREAIDLIFAAKQRPSSDPIIVHIASKDQLHDVAIRIPDLAKEIANQFWPGPLTIILKRNPKIPENVAAGLSTVAVRFPLHQVPLELIREAQVPIAAPSANLFMHSSPTTADHVIDDLFNHVDMIIDGGPCSIGLESTVIDLVNTPPVLLRPGGIPLEALREVIPNIILKPEYLQLNSQLSLSKSPGMLLKHYAPKAKLLLFSGSNNNVLIRMRNVALDLISQGVEVGIMATDEDIDALSDLSVHIIGLGPRAELSKIGRNLFAAMRDLDKKHVDIILVGEINRKGLGLAIWDRLIRASEGNVIDTSKHNHFETIFHSEFCEHDLHALANTNSN